MRFMFLLIAGLMFSSSVDSQELARIYVEDLGSPSPVDIDKSQGLLFPELKTYRVFVDMEPGYGLQAVYGNRENELIIETSSSFFNDMLNGARSADALDPELSQHSPCRYDSWLSLGHADSKHIGVPLDYDAEGRQDSILPSMFSMKLDFTSTQHMGRSGFRSNDATWFMLQPVKGRDERNSVLIAQFTTDGNLYLEINVQLIGPQNEVLKCAARQGSDGTDRVCPSLIFSSADMN